MATLEVFVPSPRRNKAGRPVGFVGLNELLDAARKSRWGKKEDRIKAENERAISKAVAAEMERVGWVAPECRCLVTLTYTEPNTIRDEDNVTGGGNKVVMDALSTPRRYESRTKGGKEVWRHRNGCSAIKDDKRRYVRLESRVSERTDRERPGVLIRIETMEHEKEA